MEEFYGNCSKLIKIIKGENIVQETDTIEIIDNNEAVNLGNHGYTSPDSNQKMFQPELIQVYKIQKILNKLKQ